MFKHIGKSIQGLSFTAFIVEAVFFGVVFAGGGLYLAMATAHMLWLLAGILAACISCFLAWLGQLILYAYGKITECCEVQLELNRGQHQERPDSAPSGGKQVICAECGAKQDADAVFCWKCGAPLGDD